MATQKALDITLALIYYQVIDFKVIISQMNKRAEPGLGELLRHLVERTDGSTDNFYKSLSFNYRARFTPIMRALQYGPASVTDLGSKLSVTQGAVSQTIKLMIADDLIEKNKGDDARRSIVSLSAHGQAVLQQLKTHWKAIFTAIDNLEVEIQLPLMRCLERAVDALEKKSYVDRITDSELDLFSTPDKNHKKEFFQTGGDRYAKCRPTYPDDLSHSLAALVSNHDLALDVGCGSGQLTTLLARHFSQVIGTDPSEDQLRHATPDDHVTYLQQAAEDIELPDNSVDLIVSAQAAHWFDLDRFYPEVTRVAKQDAAIALVSYGVPYISDPVNAVFQQGYWQDVHEFWPPEREHVETGYADLYFPFKGTSFPNHSYRKEMTVEELINYIRTWSAFANTRNNAGQDKFNRFFDKLRNAWHEDDAKEIVWPISVRAARIHQ